MFVALDLAEPARAELAAWRDALIEGRRDLRPVREEALHVTLAFLGWQDEAAAEAIAAAALGSGGSAPLLRATGVKPLPPRDPRLFALDLEDPSGRAAQIQAGVSSALTAGGWYVAEKRPFWPHVTLARVKRGERRAPGLPAEPAPPGEAFPGSALTLYRSTLRPQGALYEPLARATLS